MRQSKLPAEALLPSRVIGSDFRFSRAAHASVAPSDLGGAIVHGENTAVLAALQGPLEGQVRCAYLDPPYNNNEKYTHYSDRWEHEKWREHLMNVIQQIKPFLSEDGSIWISIDDREIHRLRVICEEVFGVENYATTIVWNHRKSRENRKFFSANHEYVLIFAKVISKFKASRNGLPPTACILARYKNPDNDNRGVWQSISANVQAGHATPAQFYTVTAPSGAKFEPPKGRCWVYNKIRMDREISLGNIYFGKNGTSAPRLKGFLADAKRSLTPDTLWLADDVSTTDSAKKHAISLIQDSDVFETPKPEKLIGRILTIATNPGDLVLDPYLGSGTTCAVAHKMGRRYLGIEAGPHALTHCAVRMRKVIEGESGGISNETGWTGGGGFDYFEFEQANR